MNQILTPAFAAAISREEEQRRLLLEPIQAYDGTVLVLIDAIDEISNFTTLAAVLSRTIPNLPKNIRLILTTRIEQGILCNIGLELFTAVQLEIAMEKSFNEVQFDLESQFWSGISTSLGDSETHTAQPSQWWDFKNLTISVQGGSVASNNVSGNTGMIVYGDLVYQTNTPVPAAISIGFIANLGLLNYQQWRASGASLQGQQDDKHSLEVGSLALPAFGLTIYSPQIVAPKKWKSSNQLTKTLWLMLVTVSWFSLFGAPSS